jgi:phenylacetate-coenzyme A ligase PaaK-like adenylate-forming protein
MHYQLKAIANEKNKALKVLVETKNKLEKCRKMAMSFLATNETDISIKQKEISELQVNQAELQLHVSQIDKSIEETNKILGV